MVSDSDKIIITQYPPLPSTCCICNRSSNGERRYIDFQMSLDVYGAVVICTECMAPVAQALDYVHAGEKIILESVLSDVSVELEDLRAKNDELNRALDSLLNLRPGLSSYDSSSDEESVETDGEDEQQPPLPIEFAGGNDSESLESATVRGLKDVSQPRLNL